MVQHEKERALKGKAAERSSHLAWPLLFDILFHSLLFNQRIQMFKPCLRDGLEIVVPC